MIDWHKCYGESWSGIIVPESFCHPAKFSRALIRRIYEHAFEEGWLEAGDVVLDPFGGVALGALEAMRRGLAWVGVELEQKFVDLSQQNIDLWNETYGPHLPGWGSAVLLQGDSRNLAQVVAEAGAVVSSPPFSHPGEQPCASQSQALKDYHAFTRGSGTKLDHQMTSPGQLAALPEGDLAAAISSPPYAAKVINVSGISESDRQHRKSIGRDPDSPGSHGVRTSYGSHPGQLGQMRDGGFAEACVSSPPFEESIASDSRVGKAASYTGHKTERYGISKGQLGQESGDTFWAASRLIIEQVYQVLRPGGHAIWVTKAFVRKGKRVDFPGQWRELCEACGFVTLHQHRAWLVEDRGAQYDLMGELHERKVERKSFFRRLAEKKGSPPIDWESVICMEKPDRSRVEFE